MDNVRCYFKHGKGLGRIDVSNVESYSAAILEVRFMLLDVVPLGDPIPTVLAVVQ